MFAREKWTTHVNLGVVNVKVNVVTFSYDETWTARAYVPWSGVGECRSTEWATKEDAVFDAVSELADRIADLIRAGAGSVPVLEGVEQ
jgi:hypothetical protein